MCILEVNIESFSRVAVFFNEERFIFLESFNSFSYWMFIYHHFWNCLRVGIGRSPCWMIFHSDRQYSSHTFCFCHDLVLSARTMSQSFAYQALRFLQAGWIPLSFLLPHCFPTSPLDVWNSIAIFVSLVHSRLIALTTSLSRITFLDWYTLWGTGPI